MSSGTRAAKRVKPEPEAAGVLRLFTSIKDDMATAYADLKQSTGLDDPELLRQALIRLLNEVRSTGELVIKKLGAQ